MIFPLIISLANTLGRRWTNSISFLLAAVFCIPTALLATCEFKNLKHNGKRLNTALPYMFNFNLGKKDFQIVFSFISTFKILTWGFIRRFLQLSSSFGRPSHSLLSIYKQWKPIQHVYVKRACLSERLVQIVLAYWAHILHIW